MVAGLAVAGAWSLGSILTFEVLAAVDRWRWRREVNRRIREIWRMRRW